MWNLEEARTGSDARAAHFWPHEGSAAMEYANHDNTYIVFLTSLPALLTLESHGGMYNSA